MTQGLLVPLLLAALPRVRVSVCIVVLILVLSPARPFRLDGSSPTPKVTKRNSHYAALSRTPRENQPPIHRTIVYALRSHAISYSGFCRSIGMW